MKNLLKTILLMFGAAPAFALGSLIAGTNPSSASISSGTLPSGSTYYIQNSGTPSTSTQVFNVSSGTVTGQTLLARDSGNVGIRTASPAAPLQVNPLTSVGVVDPLALSLGGTFGLSAVGKNLKLKFYDGGGSSADYGFGISAGLFEMTVGGGGDFAFFSNAAVVPTEYLRIKTGGNVGIGTIAPANKLDVSGAMALGTYAGVNTAPSNGLIVSGNVGIGTPTTSNPLAVVKSGNPTLNNYATYAALVQQGAGGYLSLGGDANYSYIQSFATPLQMQNQGNNISIGAGGFGGSVGIGILNPTSSLHIVSPTTNTYEFQASTSSVIFHVAVSTYGHIVTNGPVPTLSSCGTTPSVVGDDNQGTITVGSGVTTACTLTFANSWNVAPVCTITDNSTAVTGDISAISATAVTFGFSATLGSGTIFYRCGCSGPTCK